MQVTCLNCSARYLVDPAAIGPTGRTVQCFRCGHKWFERPALTEAELAQPEAVPDFIIRPPGQDGSATLPAIPVDPGLPVWLKGAIGVLVMLAVIAGGTYLFRDQVTDPLVVDQQTAKVDWQAGADGKTVIVVSGDIINTGHSEAAARRLHLTFNDAEGKMVAARAIEIDTGRIPPNGRAKFEARIDDLPTASVKVGIAAK